MRRSSFLAALLGASTLSFVVLASGDAKACGGCFHEEAPATQSPSVVTDHRMVLAITPTMTTLWDQVQYVGDPGGFAWVLPIRGQVVVGVGSDSFINSLDQGTQPVITAPASSCAPVSYGGGRSSSSGGCGMSSSDDSMAPTSVENGGAGTGWQEDSGVFVTNRSVVGPYETVQVHGKSAGGIIAWLRANKYHVDTDLEPMLQKYVDEGFDFVAVRLRPDVGVNAMRPIRVSFKGAYPSLPLRMVRAGVGDHVGIKLFVVADGRWRTANFPTQSIDPAMITWDFAAQRSDYTTLRDAGSAKFNGRAFTLESSIDIGRSSVIYDDPPAPPVDSGVPATDTGAADAFVPAIDSSPASEAGGDAGDDAAEADPADGAATDGAVDDASTDAAPSTDAPAADGATATDTGSLPDYDAGAPPEVDPYANDVEIAFGTLSFRRVTRLRADLPSRALDTDLELEADDAQNQLSQFYYPTKRANETCATGFAADDAGTDACSCTVPDSDSSTVPHVAIAAAALACAFIRRRRR
jgi:MYXO-CTERM domain-containing protein